MSGHVGKGHDILQDLKTYLQAWITARHAPLSYSYAECGEYTVEYT